MRPASLFVIPGCAPVGAGPESNGSHNLLHDGFRALAALAPE